MFKIPVCPYCGKALRYKSGMRLIIERRKECVCRGCSKRSGVRYKAACAKMAAVFAVIMILVNTITIKYSSSQTLLPNLIITLGAIFVYFLLRPLRMKLLEIPGQRDPEPKRKKNRRRHEKTKNIKVTFNENPLEGTSFDK